MSSFLQCKTIQHLESEKIDTNSDDHGHCLGESQFKAIINNPATQVALLGVKSDGLTLLQISPEVKAFMIYYVSLIRE